MQIIGRTADMDSMFYWTPASVKYHAYNVRWVVEFEVLIRKLWHGSNFFLQEGFHWNLFKGQLNSEWIYEVILSPKTPTKNLKDFCPTL